MSDPLGGKAAAPGKGPAGHWAQTAGLGCFLALVQQSTSPRSSAPVGSRSQPHRIPVFLGDGAGPSKRLRETLRLSCLGSRCPGLSAAPRRSTSAWDKGPAPARASSGPLTSSIAPPSCLSDSALPAPVAGLLLPRVLWGAGSQGGGKGPLGSENSQETQNWEQQQQQETEGAGRTPALPPRCATLTRAPNGMG